MGVHNQIGKQGRAFYQEVQRTIWEGLRLSSMHEISSMVWGKRWKLDEGWLL